MKCKSKTVRGARLIAVSVAVLCGLCVCFVSCNNDAGEDSSDTTSNSGSTTTTGGITTYTTTWGGTESTDSVFDSVTVTVQSGFITGVKAVANGTTYTADTTDYDTVWTVTVGDAVYTITIEGSGGSYTYTYALQATATASWGGTGENALSGYTFTVAYTTDSEGTATITKVVASISGESTQLSGTDGVYTLSVTGEGGYEALYTITFVYSNSAVSYTYSATAVEDAEATGGLSSYGVHVKYISSGGSYTVQALAVDDGKNPVTLSADDSGYYTYTVGSDGLYTSEEDSVVTTYTITLVTSKAPTYTYTYTYVKTTTSDYTATGGISGTTITANATVTETYNGSSSTYTVDSLNSVSIGGSTVSANSDGTYTYTVDSDSTVTEYTITLAESTSGGVSYSYTYTSVLYYKATGAMDETVLVALESGSISTVTVGGTEATLTTTTSTNDTATVTISGAEYTLAISGSASAGYTYTTTLTATGSLSKTVLVTVDAEGEITAVTLGGTECSEQGDGSYFCESGDMTYFITLSGGSTSYSYTCEEYFGASDTGYADFQTLLSSLSSGCTIVLYPGLTSAQFEWFITALANSSLSNVAIDMSYTTAAITEVDSDTFSGCSTKITSLILPSSVTTIGSKAFYQFTKLTSVEIPGSITSIGSYAFYCCTSLTSVTIGDSVTSIGERAFEGCSFLTEVTIPDSVTSLGARAFSGCTSLVTAVIGDGVKTIPSYTFYHCTALTTVTIGSSVTAIDYTYTSGGAFSYCEALTTVYYNGTKDEWAAISISGTEYEYRNYYLTKATIICTDGTYTY